MARCSHCGEANPGRARFCLACGESLIGPSIAAAEVRKTVTVLFCDLVDSTPLGEQLDPESLRWVIGRYFQEARRVLEHHGGKAVRFIGDAVMAVFGVPTLHEDDALRAVAAATKLRTALAVLNNELGRDWAVRLDSRTGVNTGEVAVVESADNQVLVFGDAANLAARLEQAAGIGEILIGKATYQLVRDAVIAEPTAPLVLKGKGAPVPAWRLLEVDSDARGHARRVASPMVGRQQDLAMLRSVFERAVSERRCHLVTVLGGAGIGKTRLIEEFSRFIRRRATILQGSCRSYGEGITYWPIAQMIRRMAGIQADEAVETSLAKLHALLGDDGNITTRVAQVIGLRRGTVEAEDTYWTLQRMLDLFARTRPLVLIVDDLHWAEPALLRFIEHLAQWSGDSPILVICLARSELLDNLRNWSGSKPNATSMSLSPLTDAETEELVGHILGEGDVDPAVRVRLARTAAGYPLFVEELVRMLTDDGSLYLTEGSWILTDELAERRLPPTIQALLGARLDELAERERLVLGRCAVMGLRFQATAVTALSSDRESEEAVVTLMALVRKELLHPDTNTADAPGPGHDWFSFRHSLVRDAAYQRVSKDARADLHERYASWVAETQSEQLPETDEVVGYHLERAYQHRVELGRLDVKTRALGQRAGERLTAAGRRAAARGDIPATAAALLARAIELLPQDHEGRLDALLDLADALREAENLAEALQTYQVALEVAEGSNNARGRAHAAVGRMDALWFQDPVDMLTNGPLEAEWAVRVLQQFQDDLGLAKAWRLLAYVHFAAGKATEAQKAAEHAVAAARRVGDEHWQARIVRLHCVILFWGPVPLGEVIRYNEQALEWAKRTGMRTLEACALRILARAAAMEGRFDEARRHNRTADAIKPDLGELLTWAADSISKGLVELAAGQLEDAEYALRQGFEKASRIGATGHLTSIAAMLARVHLQQARNEEAETIARICERVAPATQLDPQIKARAIRAVVLSRRGQHEEAEILASEAMALAERSEQLNSQAETLLDLGEVLRNAGQFDEAERLVERSIRCFERKGNLVGAANAREARAELGRLRGADGRFRIDP